MSWIYYLLEANLYMTAFYLLYYFILKNETHYQLNRAFLLFTSALAFIIPLVQLGFLKPEYKVAAPLIAQVYHPVIVTLIPPANNIPHWDWHNYLLAVYIGVACILTVNLLIKIYKVIKLSRQNKTTISNGYKLIETDGESEAFSFFGYLFISNKLPLKQTIINHELIHIRQKHSWDMIYFELLKIFNWFNPLIYLLQYSIRELHEFIADRETVRHEQNSAVYTDFLLDNAYGINQNSLINTFFNKSLLKKRIIMLHQKPSGSLDRLKYLAALPVFGALLCASTMGFSKTYGWIDLAPKQKNDTTKINKKVHNDKYVNTNEFTNAKGYKIQEKIVLDNNNWSQKVAITGKDGKTHVYYNEKSTPAERKMLLETYGYEFPKMKVTGVTLTSPPINNPKIPPPPPPAPPHKLSKKSSKGITVPAPPNGVKKSLPPPPPAKTSATTVSPKSLLETLPDSATIVKANKVTYKPSQETPGNPVIVINGKRYYLKEKLRHGQKLICSADTVNAYVADGADYPKQFGEDAKNGVIMMYGKNPTVVVE